VNAASWIAAGEGPGTDGRRFLRCPGIRAVDAAGVPSVPVNFVEKMSGDEQVIANCFRVDVEHAWQARMSEDASSLPCLRKYSWIWERDW